MSFADLLALFGAMLIVAIVPGPAVFSVIARTFSSGFSRGLMMIVVRFLRRLADAGQAILCTIHQPSAVLFEMFDDLIPLFQNYE